MKARRIANNVMAFDADGIAESLVGVSSAQLRGSGSSEELIGYVERYRRGSSTLQQYEQPTTTATQQSSEEPATGSVHGKI